MKINMLIVLSLGLTACADDLTATQEAPAEEAEARRCYATCEARNDSALPATRTNANQAETCWLNRFVWKRPLNQAPYKLGNTTAQCYDTWWPF